MPAVGGLVDAVAGETAGEQSRPGLVEAMRDEAMRAVHHRDDKAGALACAFALEQGGEDLRHCAECARREVGDREGRQGRRGVPEHSGPAEVVQVVPRALLVAPAESEAGDRAVDGALRDLLGTDAQPGCDAGPERLEHDVRLGDELERRRRILLEVDLDRLLAGAQSRVPGRSCATQRIPSGRLDADDARAELEQLARRERAGEIAAEVDDQHSAQRLHRRTNLSQQHVDAVRDSRDAENEGEHPETVAHHLGESQASSTNSLIRSR